MNKNVLLIGGGGTLGTAIAEELLKLGHCVDIICPEEKESHHENLFFYQNRVSEELLTQLFEQKHYHGIVNLIHYRDVEAYKPMHKLLTDHTDHLIFLSSYRVYADLEHPVTENAPQLLNVSTDEAFVQNEKYAIAKAKGEKFLRESGTENWTVVRPVISFSQYRFDLVTRSNREIIEKTEKGEVISLPAQARNLTAGLDWAGNTGKLIAHLLFKTETFGQAYTVSSAQDLTWEEVAELYTKLIGARFEWVDTERYCKENVTDDGHRWRLFYDRFFDRRIDNSKILAATGLKPQDFTSIEEGLRIELRKAGIDV